MSMPGFWEFAFLAVLALLIFGPEKLPGMARTVGRSISQFRREAQGALEELKRAADVEELRKVGEELKGTAADIQGSVAEIEREAATAGQSAARPYGGTLAGGGAHAAAGTSDAAAVALSDAGEAGRQPVSAGPPPFDPDAT